MTLEADGSATAQPNAGTPEVSTSTGAAAGSAAGAATADPFSGLDAGTLEWIGKAGIKDVSTLAAKARNAESLIGKAVVLPGEDAKPEDWGKVYDRLGRPESADKYEFALPEGLPEDFTYSKEFADEARAKFHEAGLSTKQAAALHDWFVSKTAGTWSAQKEAGAQSMTERVNAATDELIKMWGSEDSDTYKTKRAAADRTWSNLSEDVKAELAGLNLVTADGVVLAPKLVDFFATASALYREDSLETGGTGTTDNPFVSGNLTEQMRVVRTDPNRARRMIAASGKRPSDFGLSD